MADTAANNGEVIEDVKADHVTISQGGANSVEATTVEVSQGGIQAVKAEHVTITQGGAFIVETTSAELTMSGSGLIAADTITLRSGGAGLVVADTLKAEPGSIVGFLFAGSIEGNPDVKVDLRTAAAMGAGFAVALFALRRLFRSR